MRQTLRRQRTAEPPSSVLDRPSRGLLNVQRDIRARQAARRATPCKAPSPCLLRPAIKVSAARSHEDRPRPALSRPEPGRRSGVNGVAIQHNRALRKVRPFAALRSARWAHRSGLRPPRPSGSRNGRLCLAPRPSLRAAALPLRLNICLACSRFAPARVFSQAAAPQCGKGTAPARRPSAPHVGSRTSVGVRGPDQQKGKRDEQDHHSI